MNTLFTISSILLLAWLIAGMPTTFVKITTMRHAAAQPTATVDAYFTPGR